jgi:hypothetical protein
MNARTIVIKAIARIISIRTDSRSEPNTIGKGPISKTPALLVWSPLPLAFIASNITATKAKMNPAIMRSRPASARLMVAKSSPLSRNRKLREL